MSLLAWTAAAYVLLLPPGYHLESQRVERIEGPGGLGTARETACTWRDPAGGTLTFQWWQPAPPRPGGPLVAAREVPGRWAGAPAAFVEARVFDGVPARVSVAFQELSPLGGRARLSATGMELETLRDLLGQASVRALTPDEAGHAGCGRTPG